MVITMSWLISWNLSKINHLKLERGTDMLQVWVWCDRWSCYIRFLKITAMNASSALDFTTPWLLLIQTCRRLHCVARSTFYVSCYDSLWPPLKQHYSNEYYFSNYFEKRLSLTINLKMFDLRLVNCAHFGFQVVFDAKLSLRVAGVNRQWAILIADLATLRVCRLAILDIWLNCDLVQIADCSLF